MIQEKLSMNLENQTAIVTGAAQGFGLAIAKQLKSQGANIVMWDLDETTMQEAAKEIGEGTITYQVDVANWDNVKEVAQQTLQEVGTIEILVNNAGISGPTKPTVDYAIDDWHDIINIDLHGVFYCCKAILPHLDKNNYGRIVNIASIAGKEGNANAAAYSAAKAGVIALTKSLGKEYAKQNIAVNCVTPAVANTRILEQVTQEHIDFMLSKIPRGRFVEVTELAAMVGWLASPVNSFTTGGVFDISGGRATY